MEAERRTGAASAASHAEPYIRKLCSTFVDPIDSISMTDDDLLVVALKIPPNANARACMPLVRWARARTGSRLRARRPSRSKGRRSSSWCPTHCWRRSRNSALRPGNSYPSDAQTGAFGITWRPPQLQFTVPPCRKRKPSEAFPARAGMNRGRSSTWSTSRRVPRMRRDEPGELECTYCERRRSPHGRLHVYRRHRWCAFVLGLRDD